MPYAICQTILLSFNPNLLYLYLYCLFIIYHISYIIGVTGNVMQADILIYLLNPPSLY
jgi:hypothetical protein